MTPHGDNEFTTETRRIAEAHGVLARTEPPALPAAREAGRPAFGGWQREGENEPAA
jgi:hypothetical protein